jgi:hypothetical protein
MNRFMPLGSDSRIAVDHSLRTRSQRWPRWLDEIELALPVCSQFVLYGNVRDTQLIPTSDGPIVVSPIQGLWERLKGRDYAFLLVFDPTEGLRVYPEDVKNRTKAVSDANEVLREVSWIKRDGRNALVAQECDRSRIPEIMRMIVGTDHTRCALVIENASRLVLAADRLDVSDRNFFAACERIARSAVPRKVKSNNLGRPLFNPVIWLADRVRDLPDWFVIGNERVRTIAVPVPDFEERRTLAEQLAIEVDPNVRIAEPPGSKQVEQFAANTEGLTQRAMYAVTQVARDQQIPLERIADAIRCYTVGVSDDPWKKPYLRERIRRGEEEIRSWVKGQDLAVRKTLDILTRSVTGLSGAQASSSISRPRGVLFFAGPTGVGKTELAKAISRLIFGDANACIRFDMSEFSAEHSDARLIGAPPGYIGYDVGGELVNAVRQRPFSVLLFDEIEKAHKQILDKFLQILGDGRLTDGRGDTVYFSEAIIVFTSNLGLFSDVDRVDQDQLGRQIAIKERMRTFDMRNPPDYSSLEMRVRGAIADHFHSKLERPELLNRIGEENIIVFDFIRPTVARDIFKKAIESVKTRVRETNELELLLPSDLENQLLARCTSDLKDGGRGIGNSVEQNFINPLARALFELNAPSGARVTVDQIDFNHPGYSIKLSCKSV